MKNKLYYILFIFYMVGVAFILYINGVFTGEVYSYTNLAINGVFLLIIGILFVVSAFSFSRLTCCTEELQTVTEQMQDEYDKADGQNLWGSYQNRTNLFQRRELKEAYLKYLMRMQNGRTRRGYVAACDIEEFFNEDLLDKVGMTFFNSGISGTLTGLGILGTFLGLSMGLGSFNGDDIYTISDNVGPLLSGMKVAFHTSVYGIFFSLVFSFVFRKIMADAYGKLDEFLTVFRQCAMPPQVTEEENSSAMLVYQANMANSMKRMLELLQGITAEQTQGVERIVGQVVEHLEDSMGTGLKDLGNTIAAAGQSQTAYANACMELTKAAAKLMESGQKLQKSVAEEMDRQEAFARELKNQKEEIRTACREMTDEVSNQLYTFEQMRSLYEK
ncbi:hypothetical protein AALB64_12130 [Lachnospiraceae bacterium 45-P1]